MAWWSVAALLLLSSVVVGAVKVLEWVWWRPKRVEKLLTEQGIRGSPYRFLFGDSMEIQRLAEEAKTKAMPLLSNDFIPRVFPFLFRSTRQHGGKLSLSWSGPNPTVAVLDPGLVKEVLNNKHGHFTRPKPTPFGKFLSKGLASYDGDKWAKHRRILSPAFHFEKLKSMWPEFGRSCTDLIKKWSELIGSANSYEIDVFPELQTLAADAISRAAFGSKYEEGNMIFQLLSEHVMLLARTALMAQIPGYRFLPSNGYRRMKEIAKEIDSIIRAMITEREKSIKSGEKVIEENLLGLLLDSNMIHQENGNKQKGMSVDEVVDECVLFYLAGQETTNILLTWTMVLLSLHPFWQDSARKEVLQAFGKNKPSFEELNRLKIVNMILLEVLRLYSPANYFQRSTSKSVKLGEFTIPPGVDLLLPVIFLHHDEEIWGEDAKEFNPERFAEGATNAAAKQHAFFPFGWGPRICIGQNFALLESKMAIAMLLQHFSFEISPSYTHAPHAMVTLRPQYGAQIILHKL